jgi:small subunit ribosomal protein S21
MLLIKIKDNESIDRALRRYKKKFEKTGILREVRNRMYFTKPSVDRREMLKKARRREEHYAADNY